MPKLPTNWKSRTHRIKRPIDKLSDTFDQCFEIDSVACQIGFAVHNATKFHRWLFRGNNYQTQAKTS
jgi:hypothetical protein